MLAYALTATLTGTHTSSLATMATTFVLVVVPTTFDASDACAYGVAWCLAEP